MNKKWFLFWTLAGLESLWGIFSIFRIPSEGQSAVLFGLSMFRLLLVILFMLLLAGSVLLARLTVVKAELFVGESGRNWRQMVGWAGILSGFLVILGVLFLRPPIGNTAFSRAVFERIEPLLQWLGAFALQTVLLMLLFKRESSDKQFFPVNLRLTAAALFGTLGLYGLTRLSLSTGLGLNVISGTFYRQGVSLLEGQLIVPLLVFFSFMLIVRLLKYSEIDLQALFTRRHKFFFSLTAIAIWYAAASIWINTPFEGRSYFLPALRPPNMNFYPASDAENYDMLAQSILIGNGFRNGMTVVRPFYVIFLSILHLLTGNDYIALTNLQIVVLALFPAAVFMLGCQLRIPFGGLLAAIWIIFREIYSIRLTPLVQVSNSRLLMSDLPMALLIVLILNALVAWYRAKNRKTLWSLVCGWLCAIGILVRTQTAILIPAIVMIMVFCAVFRKQKGKNWLGNLVLFIIAVMVVCLPWFISNRLSPNTTVSQDTSESAYLVRLYENAARGESSLTDAADETNSNIFETIRQSPLNVLRSIGAHFLNNTFSALLVLPVRTEQAEDVYQWFNEPDPFWYRVTAQFVFENNLLLLLFYGFLICLGIAQAVRLNAGAGLSPLLIHLVYSLGNAVAMTSGFRFILPVDWVTLFYFAFGCVSLVIMLLELLQGDAGWSFILLENKRTDGGSVRVRGTALAFTILLITGLILPVADRLIPYRYAKYQKSADLLLELETEYPKSFADLSTHSLRQKVNTGEMDMLIGRAVYPRLYRAGEGDSGGNASVKVNAEDDRLVWMFLNERVHVLSLKLKLPKTDYGMIPDPMDVAVFGKQQEDYFEVFDMVSLSDDGLIWQVDALEPPVTEKVHP